MKKFNECFGVANSKAQAEELIKKLGKGHAVRSGGVWRVYQYPPGEIGKNSLFHPGIKRSPPTNKTGGQ